ncbi:C-type lectin domain family 3 member A-like isoform X2 [Neodiprion fabricii]|uniref:C-type lectin domain family 3 member A-like isoform X2 n=1 Tax=Neodiprion fabricii TaxID=2872261 RepID=UPI001ED924DE|nr:C-type lectin domain family 3 member A-like isoform X2 [Neodiprion fabricii]
MAALLVSLPMHLACQIMCADNSTNGNVTFVQNTSTRKQNSSPLPEGYISFPDIGVAYKLHDRELVLWNEARRRCIEDGATLAVIDSLKKLEYVKKMKLDSHHLHIGIHRFFDRDEWTSVKTGLPVSFVPWSYNEPTNEKDQYCVMMWSNGSGLAAANCYKNTKHFICEIPI